MEKVQKIREEVVRLYNQSLADENRQADRGLECAANVSYGKSKACKQLLSFIDTLEVKEEKEEPVSEDLKEFEVEYFEREKDNIVCVYDRHAGLVDGAKWQKQQDQETIELTEDYAMLAGMEKMKKEIMEKAIDGEVGYWNLRGLSINAELPHSVEEGDKVKVIVIKED